MKQQYHIMVSYFTNGFVSYCSLCIPSKDQIFPEKKTCQKAYRYLLKDFTHNTPEK